MSNVTIDINALTAALAQALPVAIKAAVEASATPAKPLMEVEKPEPPPRKRGRPKKTVIEPVKEELGYSQTYITVDENIEEVNDDQPRNPSTGYVFNAKKFSRTNVVGNACGMEDVTKKRGKMKFMDIQNVGDRIPASKYPEPSERRQPVEKMMFECDRCGRNFEAYPSEVPQAFIKEKITGVAEGQPRVICERCVGR